MKRSALILFSMSATVTWLAGAELTHRLSVDIAPRFDGKPLVFDALTNGAAAGQFISVTRLDFLASGFALRRADGEWLHWTNQFAYLSARQGRTSFEIDNIPAGQYGHIRFQVGVPPAINHADPARFPAGHPLNPNVNGLHWSWQGGYVFLALEGNWIDVRKAPTDAIARGYSFHVATDRQLMTVELPLALTLTADSELRLGLEVDRIFAATHNLRINEDTASTHSREDDPLAGQLRDNIQRAFTVERILTTKLPLASSRGANKVEIAPDATPYRLTISRFFPRPALPLDNPLTEEGVELGRRLFQEPLLSINGRQSCASCHQPEAGFSDAGQRLSLGADGQPGARNAMPLFNLAWKSAFFWDGRAATLREQVLMPIQNPVEMHESLSNVIVKLQQPRSSRGNEALTDKSEIRNLKSEIDQSLLTSAATETEINYPGLFSRAFGSREITADRIARALEQFLLTLTARDSRFDRSLKGEEVLTAEEKRGFELFHTEYDPRRGQFGADCFHCHGGPLFQSQSFANNGLDAGPRDLGRFLATGKAGDRGKFAVPSLRNIAMTAPYMHDGRFATLEAVIEHYVTGVKRSLTLDPNLAKHPDGGVPLSATDQQALVAFLGTLTDERLLPKAVTLTSKNE